MTEAVSRGLLFGAAAESYERFRLGYPDDVVDRTLAYAGRPVEQAVEVGAGTGKATRVFASRGVHVTALEPDPDMLTVLRRETAGMSVVAVKSDLESYAGAPVDLVYAAAAWHWVDPATRCAAAAALLPSGGTLAVFGGPLRLVDPALQEAIAHAVGLDLDDLAFQPPAPERPDRRSWLDDELRAHPSFTDVEDHRLPREVSLPQREYVGHLSTLSAFLQLPMETRQDLLRRIAGVVPAQVRVDLGIGLHLARRI